MTKSEIGYNLAKLTTPPIDQMPRSPGLGVLSAKERERSPLTATNLDAKNEMIFNAQHKAYQSIAHTMETTPSDIHSEAAAAALDPPRSATPAAAAVSTEDIDGTSISARSDIMSDEKMMAAKDRFYELLDEKASTKKRRKLLSEQEYNEICNVLNGWKAGAAHSGVQAKWRQNYSLLENTSHSAALRWNKNNENLKVATKEQTFTIIMGVHIELAHARDARNIHTKIAKTWYGITREDVVLTLHLCPICMASQTKITAKQRPLKMILSATVGSRAQMDLIDMTSQQDDGYCWILRLIDHLSGFGAVKPLKSKTAKECGIAIIQILSFFPDFAVLQSDNGGEFLGETIEYLNESVNCVTIIHVSCCLHFVNSFSLPSITDIFQTRTK